VARLPVNTAAALAWLFVVGASLATYTVVDGHRLGAASAVSLVVAIAAIKARMIVLHFMEMKHAPAGWRIALECWVFGAASLILGLWFFAGGADCRP
jgi:cytochrome c oxidase subunit IV